jgi:cyclophilin family peptidyl-prolyl cis-trans isomerase
MFRSIRLASFFLGAALVSLAQSTVPTLSTPFPARTLVAGGPSLSINLRDYLSIPTVTGSLVQFDTTMGKFNVELFSADVPRTVNNFLNYVNRGAYSNSIIHRSIRDPYVIQGGSYVLNGTNLPAIATDAPIELEVKFSNTRGTLAMARTSDLNSATSGWYFNVGSNTALDTTGGGYAVFGHVLGTGMTVVDALAAVPVYDKSAQLGSAYVTLPLLNDALATSNLVMIKSVKAASIFPQVSGALPAVIDFGESTIIGGGVLGGDLSGSTLTLKPVAPGTVGVRVRAIDTNGNALESTFTVTVVTAPLFTTHPANLSVAEGGNGLWSVAATGGATLQWQRNGANISTTGANVSVENMQAGYAGLYTVDASANGAKTTSSAAILGVTTSKKVIGAGSEIASNIVHPNGNTFDQVLPSGAALAVTAEYSPDPAQNQITRTSFIDLQDDIVQVELGGPGTLTITFDEASGPAAPVKYNQPLVSYVKGHANITIAGADEHTNLSIFTVGRATAFDPTGAYNILLPPSTTNDPANNGSPLFQGHESTAYEGIADIGRISISSTNGRFGGIRAANAWVYDTKGIAGIYAPGVAFDGPIYIANITAFGTSTPVFMVGSVSDARITGGDLYANNGQPIQVSGLTQLKFTGGSDSAGRTISAKLNQGILYQNGVNVTNQLVVNPQ